MSFKRKGQLSKSPERLQHLGNFLSRLFWKRERKAEKKLIAEELLEKKKDVMRRDDFKD